MRAALAALTLTFATGGASYAADKPRPLLDACMQAPGGSSTQGMANCQRAETGREDVRLNKAYAGAMAKLNARQKTKLRTAQRAWIAFRDANCKAELDPDWGTIQTNMYAGCLLNMTSDRADELETYRDTHN